MFKKIIISAPFGNWITSEHATSTLGTFTYQYRGGLLYRMWRMLRTLRYQRRFGGWTNRLGLPNPGLRSLPLPTLTNHYDDKIISIHGFSADDWDKLGLMVARYYKPLAAELNLSCPNVNHKIVIDDAMMAVFHLMAHAVPVIAKLPPVKWMDFVKPLYNHGVRIFHCCNTIPTPAGGLSGSVLKQYSMWAVEEIRQCYGSSVIIIGGGGVSSPMDVSDYLRIGANSVAVGSYFLNPFRWKNIAALAAANATVDNAAVDNAAME